MVKNNRQRILFRGHSPTVEEMGLEVVVACDEAYGSIGYYMKLPKSAPIEIKAVDVILKNFIFDDGFDYGTDDDYCGERTCRDGVLRTLVCDERTHYR